MNSVLKRLSLDKSIFKDTVRLALPAMIESFFIAFAGLVDSLMVSSISSFAVAAVGITTQPKFIALALFIALSVATSAVVARRFGEGRRDEANRTLLTSLAVAVIACACVSAIFVAFADEIISFCGSTENTHDDAVTYFEIIIGGMIFNCIQMVINAAQRGSGNTKITMLTNVTSNTVNVIFNYLLIGGHFGFPALGIRGAAIATVLGTVVSSVMSIISLIPKGRFLNFSYIIKEKILPKLSTLAVLCKFGYSVFIEQILLRIGFAATAIMAANLGDDPMAAHQAAMNIMGVSFACGDGLQHAAVALIGKSLGRRDPERAKKYGRCCQVIGGCVSVIYFIIFFGLGRSIMTLFFPDKPHIVDIGTSIIYVLAPTVLFQIVQVIFMGCLRGAGDTLYTAITSTVCVTVVRTAASYIFGYTLGIGIVGVWLGIFADQFCRFWFSLVRFAKGKWVNIRL